MKATIRRPDGTVVDCDGTAEEIRTLLAPSHLPEFSPAPKVDFGRPWWGIVPPPGMGEVPTWTIPINVPINTPGKAWEPLTITCDSTGTFTGTVTTENVIH